MIQGRLFDRLEMCLEPDHVCNVNPRQPVSVQRKNADQQAYL